jgi:N-methylhydantoinase B
MDRSEIDPVTLGIIWTRLISAADEAAATMVRAAFSTILRESNDLSVVLLDPRGDSLVQSTQSIPTFIGTIPVAIKHFLRRYPSDQLEPGDVIVSNDPWLTSGHLPDITVMVPIFRDDEFVAICGTCGHLPDIGGTVRNPALHEVFEEGLRIPPLKLMRRGSRNDELFELIRTNVRMPDQVVGDLYAHMAAAETVSRRTLDILNDYGLRDLAAVGRQIQSTSERAIREAIRRMAPGDYTSTIKADGIGSEVTIVTRVSVGSDSIVVNYDGTSAQVGAAINVPASFTYAQTVYPLKCILSPDIPNNEGTFRPIVVEAPEGSILNARFPAAVGTRHVVGHMLSEAVCTALACVVPESVQAASFSPQWCAIFTGHRENGESFSHYLFCSGGQGASAETNGLACLSFPSNVAASPVEVTETVAPLRVEKKRLREWSGGAGAHRGGDGQEIVVRVLGTYPVTLSLVAGRLKHPAPGLFGGGEGTPGGVFINDRPIDLGPQQVLQPGDVLRLVLPGGGGFGASSA